MSVLLSCSFYKNPELVDLFDSFLDSSMNELIQNKVDVFAICDSPEDATLLSRLKTLQLKHEGKIKLDLVINEQNLGYLQSINKALRAARQLNYHALLVNSDAVLHRGVVSGLLAVLHADPMIGFVSPRTDNAIFGQEIRLNARNALTQLPQYYYAPTAVGFCSLIKNTVLMEFGQYDPIFGRGYEEENDLVMRANRRGYRAALANWVHVAHMGSKSFGDSEEVQHLRQKNFQIMKGRYPEYPKAIELYNEKKYALAENLLVEAIDFYSKRSKKILIHAPAMGYHVNGTSVLCRNIIQSLAELGHDVKVKCNPMGFEAHKLGSFSKFFTDENETFGFGILLGQPFSWDCLEFLRPRCSVTASYFLDTIAWDCAYLNNFDLDLMWSNLPCYFDVLFFISNYSQEQYMRRFRPTKYMKTQMLSLSEQDYQRTHSNLTTEETQLRKIIGSNKYSVVFGNHFLHKGLDVFIEKVACHQAINPNTLKQNIVILGKVDIPNTLSDKIKILESGSIPEDTLTVLLKNSNAIIYPSYYEGFGIPILESLACKKPIYCRRIECYEEIKEKVGPVGRNIKFFDSTDQLVQDWISGQQFESSWIEDRWNNKLDWSIVSNGLVDHAIEANKNVTFQGLVENINRIRLLEEHANGRMPAQIQSNLRQLRDSRTFKFAHQVNTLLRKIKRDRSLNQFDFVRKIE